MDVLLDHPNGKLIHVFHQTPQSDATQERYILVLQHIIGPQRNQSRCKWILHRSGRQFVHWLRFVAQQILPTLLQHRIRFFDAKHFVALDFNCQRNERLMFPREKIETRKRIFTVIHGVGRGFCIIVLICRAEHALLISVSNRVSFVYLINRIEWCNASNWRTWGSFKMTGCQQSQSPVRAKVQHTYTKPDFRMIRAKPPPLVRDKSFVNISFFTVSPVPRWPSSSTSSAHFAMDFTGLQSGNL